MPTISLALTDVLISVKGEQDLSAIPTTSALKQIRSAYAFLGNKTEVALQGGSVSISFPDGNTVKARTLAQRAVGAAQRGDYRRATPLFEQAVEAAPENTDTWRNLGMAYLEQGEVDRAEAALLNAVRLDPQDAWTHLLLGNLYLQQRRDLSVAERCYQRALAHKPGDAFTLTNYASLLAKTGREDAARQLYREAIAADAEYPNSYYNLAVLEQANTDVALGVLDLLFDQAVSADVRANQVYETARRLYEQLSQKAASQKHDDFMALVRDRRGALEASGGVEIELVPDQRISTTAKAEIMWHAPGRRSHVVRYKEIHPSITPHLIAHELEHIALETADREAGKNKFFVTNEETRDYALRDIRSDIDKLIRRGRLSRPMVDAFINNVLGGMSNQLFNAPLDMFIEWRIWHEQPELRPSQLVSMMHSVREGLPVITDDEIRRISPRTIYRANATLNAAYAMFVDELTGGRTDLAQPYARTSFERKGQKLVAMWREANAEYQPGDEYLLVDQFAATLRLTRWYTWRNDEPRPAEEVGGTTNPKLLREKQPAAVMYCLSALERFELLPQEEIRSIVTEIAMLGQSGLDYADSAKKYTLRTVPEEYFSGLQLMCLMHVGLKDIAPTMDSGMDLDTAYHTALKLHKSAE